MVLLVLVAGETDVARNDFPCVGPMTSAARGCRVSAICMQTSGTPVAGLAIGHGQKFRLLKMTRFAGHLHHGSRRINFMAGDAVEWRPVSCPMAQATKNPFVGSFQRPWMPGL